MILNEKTMVGCLKNCNFLARKFAFPSTQLQNYFYKMFRYYFPKMKTQTEAFIF